MTLLRGVALTLAAAGLLMPMHATSGPITLQLPISYVDQGISWQEFQFSSGLSGLGKVEHHDLLSTVSAAAYATPQPRVEISGSTSASSYIVNADSYMTYAFAILSGQTGYANVLINSTAGVNGVGSYTATAEVDLVGHGGPLVYAHACNNVGYCSNVYTASVNKATSIQMNHIYTFRLHVNAHTTYSNSEFFAFADPTVTFDPAYQIPDGAHIVYSPGFTPGVPEPASWALLLTGFGLVGGMARLGRRTKLAVAG